MPLPYTASYYAYLGDDEKAIKNLERFTQGNNIQRWVPLFTPINPMIDDLKNKPEFKQVMHRMDTQFWQKHERLRTKLEQENLLQVMKAL